MFSRVLTDQITHLKVENEGGIIVKLPNENELNLYERYQTIINRWQNLKTKVMQAKQRLGPTLKEESTLIIQDLKLFQNFLCFLLFFQLQEPHFRQVWLYDRAFLEVLI